MEPDIQQIAPYTADLAARMFDQIRTACKSIYIAVAWLANTDIIEALLQQASSLPTLSIQVVVDDNETNQDYFFPWQPRLKL
jgi:phosphatidylserine/phosphatidylglycerophosphate/cardiolipin synthase-like enzyme